MRYHEISGSLRIPVSEEEQEMISLVKEQGRLPRDDLDERQQEVARLMVGRGLLNRRRRDGNVYYELNQTDAWRF